MGKTLAGWVAVRQADILLYLGAFLLSIAAIIFVAYQGDALNGPARFSILTAYSVAFLGLGLGLHRWERVREAGPVFLALGAILVPIDFIALRTQVLTHREVAPDVLWLVGSGTSALLYGLLAARGYGRVYAIPAVPAALAAWGSLGSVVRLPDDWFGAWFEGLGGALVVSALAARRAWPGWRWQLGLALPLCAAALVYAHVAAATGAVEHAAQLPLTYAFVTAAAAASHFFRRSPIALAALPAAVTMTFAAAVWAAVGLPYEWWAAFIALAAAGYLGTAHFDASRAGAWAAFAAGLGAIAAVWAHVAVVPEGSAAASLAVTYGLLLASAIGAYARWRRIEALGTLPALITMTVATSWWAAVGLAVEWWPCFIAAGGAGYLAVARLDVAERARAWGWIPLVATVVAVVFAHAAIVPAGAVNAPLPATYGIGLATMLVAYVRWRWVESLAALPALLTMTVATTWWVAFDLPEDWWPAFAAAGGGLHLVAGALDRERRARAWGLVAAVASAVAIAWAHGVAVPEGADRAVLPTVYGIALFAAGAAYARWRWAEAAASLPPLAAMAAITTWWAADGLAVEWYACFAAAAASGYLALARFDRPTRARAWRAVAAATALLALGMAHGVAAGGDANRLALPATWGIVLAGAAAGFAVWRWQWRVGAASLPLATAMTALTLSWAQFDLAPEWYGLFAVGAAAGYITLALGDDPREARRWQTFAFAAGLAGITLTQSAMAFEGTAAAALPTAYGTALAVAAFTAAWWRLAARPAIALVPPLAAAFGASLEWAAAGVPHEWISVWAAAGAAGYLITAEFDVVRRPEWRAVAAAALVGVMTCAIIAAGSAETARWEVPATFGVALVAFAGDAARRRDGMVLVVPAQLSFFGATVAWALGSDPEWWAYPAVAVAALLMATSRWWERHPALRVWGWAYAIILGPGVGLAFLPVAVDQSGHALALELSAAALLALAAWRGAEGTLRAFAPAPLAPAVAVASALLSHASYAFVLAAGASFSGAVEAGDGGQAAVFAALGFAAWFLVAAFGPEGRGFWTFSPMGFTGSTIAAFVAPPSDAALAAALAVATAGPLLAALVVRRWALGGIANSFLLLALWAAWRWQDLDVQWLPLVLAGLAAFETLALTRLRRYTKLGTEPAAVVAYLSWGPWLAAAAVAGLLLNQERLDQPAGARVAESEHWAVATAVLAMASAAVVAEGMRLWRRRVWFPGSLGLLVATLMAVATQDPENVQAYTGPIGVYLVIISLTYRGSPALFGRHMEFHESLAVAGVLFLVLPPAEQSFEPGGGKWGIELLGIGLGLLALGLVTHARWLVPSAVLTVSGVAVRFVTGGFVTAPYWLLLGIVGTVLLALGMLVLLQRQRWDNFRHAVVRWWDEGSHPHPPGSGATPVAP
jgi:hypothetical protein